MTADAKGPERILTKRLLLRRPVSDDAGEIFRRYASDPVVTRYMSWPMHRTLKDTESFLAWSEAEWKSWPAGAYLVLTREDGRLVGSTGLEFHTPDETSTGYVFARNAWGLGYATESLRAMVELARSLEVRRLSAFCHIDHAASAHVLEKGGFRFTGIKRSAAEFPNLAPGQKCDVRTYEILFRDGMQL